LGACGFPRAPIFYARQAISVHSGRNIFAAVLHRRFPRRLTSERQKCEAIALRPAKRFHPHSIFFSAPPERGGLTVAPPDFLISFNDRADVQP
jgi:hypothetical protein